MLGIITAKGPTFFLFYLVAFSVAILLGYGIQRWRLRGTADVGAVIDRLTPLQIAVLRDGPRGALCTALVRLYRQKRLRVVGGQVAGVGGGWRPDDDPLSGAIARTLEGDNLLLDIDDVSEDVQTAINGHTASLPDGLVLDSDAARQTRLLSMLPGALVMALGVIKMFRGISLGKPVLFLVIALVLSAYILFRLFSRFSRITRQGKVALTVLQNRYAALRITAMTNSDMLEDDDAVLAFAVFGRDVISGQLEPLEAPFTAYDTQSKRASMRKEGRYDDFYAFDCATPVVVAGSSSGFFDSVSSCSTGCSSCGGCGGGCGGCGGCG